ncbi:hypothetical protein [Chitinophaga sp. Cy-1792]|uniref:hypothetical protein n=1 Tax=Chitinophaga sp. Cy-1792 TaxID=2608339 RepID=UPI001421E8BE|nr:hypothetical protein [Chitinophaga sp. Cy-1792]NIG54132.1 hypothetical protein [Chitinophaga sp. Cy-1792]
MQRLYVPYIFQMPQWARYLLRGVAVLLAATLIMLLLMLNPVTDPVILIAALAFVLVSVSIWSFSNIRLEISDDGLFLKNGFSKREAGWQAIKVVEIKEIGKYFDPQIYVHYGNTKMIIANSVFRKQQMLKIMELLEMKLPATIFFASYHTIKKKMEEQKGWLL